VSLANVPLSCGSSQSRAGRTSSDIRHPLLPELVRQDCRLSEHLDFHRIAIRGGLRASECALRREPALAQNPVPCSRPREYLVGARKQELPMQGCPGHRDLETTASGMVMSMHGRFFGSINAWFKRQDAEARFASIADKPRATWQHRENTAMPKAKRGQGKPRPTRGFPMWAFLAISPRAGRNSRPFPRRLSSVMRRARRTCRLRPA
jgi:hypothetical protein